MKAKIITAVKPEISKLKQITTELKPTKTIVFWLNEKNKVKALLDLNLLNEMQAKTIALENDLINFYLKKESNFIELNEWHFHFIHAFEEEEKIKARLIQEIRKKNSIIFSAIKPSIIERTASKSLTKIIHEKKPAILIFPGKEYFEKTINETVCVSIPSNSFLTINLGKEITLRLLK